MSVTVDRVALLAAGRMGDFGLPVRRVDAVAGLEGWRPAGATAADPSLRQELLARAIVGAGTASAGVAVTWQLEKHAWFLAAGAIGGLLSCDAMAPLDEAWLYDGEHGWVEAVALPADGWVPADGAQLAARLEAHLTPLVEALSAFRARRALWRSVGDRLAQAALWCGEAFDERGPAWVLCGDALAAPSALRAPAGLELRDGRPFRRRTGCCLSHRCAGGATCEDCPLA